MPSAVWIQDYDPLGRLAAFDCGGGGTGALAPGAPGSGAGERLEGRAWRSSSAACMVAWLVFRMPAAMVLSSVASRAFVRAFPHCLADRRRGFPVRDHRSDRSVRDHEGVGRQAFSRPTTSGGAGGVLLRGILEGAAGFGAPVAISAAFLVGLGFDPFKAALLCLIANTAPVAWGSIGIPIRTLAKVTGLDVEAILGDLGTNPAVSFVLDPVLAGPGDDELAEDIGGLAAAGDHWRHLRRRTVPVVQFVGFELVDIVAAVSSMAAGCGRSACEASRDVAFRAGNGNPEANSSRALCTWVARSDGGGFPALIARAWLPYGLLVITVLLWGLPPIKSLGTPAVKEWLDARYSWKPGIPSLHLLVAKGEAVTGHLTALLEDLEKAQLYIVPVSCTGTAVFVAAVISGLLLGVIACARCRLCWRGREQDDACSRRHFLHAFAGFRHQVLGDGCRARAGVHPVRAADLSHLRNAARLAWGRTDRLGHVEQRSLRRPSEDHRIKLGLNPILMASANSTGGVMGKMIDAQSIVVAAAATGEGGREGELLRTVFWHSIVLALIVSAIVWI